jgi:D-inositol-3-phosphate glycosyltransferase
MLRIAVISVHTSPLAPAGGHKAGGMNVYVGELARELARRGNAVDVFTRRTGDEPAVVEAEDGVRVIHIDDGNADFSNPEEAYIFLPRFLRSLYCFVENDGSAYDVIHSHYWLSGWVGNMLARRWNVPHVTMFHTLGEAKNRARMSENESARRISTERRITATADKIICASQDERNILVRHYNLSPARIRVIPCGVDLDAYRPIDKAEARQSLGLDDTSLVLYVGRIEPLKGIDILIRACGLLDEERIAFKLLIVGGDDKSSFERQNLELLAKTLGIEDRVTFTGAVSHDLLPLYYSAADVCAIPSYYESFGLVAIEAMACGTPVVATRVGGLTSTIRDGETGYLIPWRCPEPFADKIETLLMNEDLGRRLGEAGRLAAEPYRWQNVADQVEGVYHELLDLTQESYS